MRILALESSCDESSLAWLNSESATLEQQIHSQVMLHKAYGGVVPDLASREHLAHLPELLASMPESWEPSLIAVTHGPGLAGCLALGIASAKALGMALRVPVVGVNHLHGHAFSPFIEMFLRTPEGFAERYADCLPHLGLVVSGGNTLLFSLEEGGDLRILAQTVDDAAGEALDKGAKLLGLGYPGGPLIEKCAREGKADAYAFPRAFAPRSEMKFSFSGLKTSLRYTLEEMEASALEEKLPDLCASYQQAVVDALVRKATHALEAGCFKSLGLSGGVANNGVLREAFVKLGQKKGVEVLRAAPEYTGDNAAMIAFAAWMAHGRGLPEPALSPALAFDAF